jgi:hypothetical protein
VSGLLQKLAYLADAPVDRLRLDADQGGDGGLRQARAVVEDGGQERSGQQPSCSVPQSLDVRMVTASSRSIWVIHLIKAPVELARLTGVPAPSLKTVHPLIDLLTRP